jgi:hypothetical protein
VNSPPASFNSASEIDPRGDADRMQPAFDVGLPETEEFVHDGKLWGKIELLPDEALQDGSDCGTGFPPWSDGIRAIPIQYVA